MGGTCRTEQSTGRRQKLNVVANHRQAYSCSAAKQSRSGPSSSFFFAVLISLHFHHHKIITSQSRDCLCKVAAVPLHASCSSAPLLLTSAACFHFFIALVERGLRAEGMGRLQRDVLNAQVSSGASPTPRFKIFFKYFSVSRACSRQRTQPALKLIY